MKDGSFTADRLLVLYDRVAEAKDAIPRLRRFVLDLAVRGKLVEQDPTDEPATELLKRIAKEKVRLVKAGEIRSQKQQDPIEAIELPCALPRGDWAWARLNEIGRLSGGMTPSMNRPDYWGGEVIWLSPKDIKSDEVSTSELKITELGLAETRLEAYPVGCLFIVARSGILKRTLPVAINRRPAASNQDLKVLVPYLNGMERYLQIMLSGFEAFILSDLVKTGTTVQSLKYDEFACQPFPLPPLAEQQRIVAKVEELMALCDRLEGARAGREAVRDRLTTATLARLTAPETDAETFPTHARAALESLPTLTTRPDQIKTLRQTILNLAVRGKLVAQDPTDEPAAELMKRIAAEKGRLFRLGETGPNKAAPELDDSDLPFLVPQGWAWAQLSSIGIISPRVRADDADVASFVSMSMISADFGVPHTHDVRRWGEIKKGYTTFAEGDVGLAKITPCFENGKSTVFRGLTGGLGAGTTELHVVRPIFMNPDYILLFLKSPMFVEAGIPRMTGTAGQKRVPTEYFSASPFPLPPLAEQHRIVAKVDALMALCDQLEASLTTATTTRSRLLEALLHEALGDQAEAAA